MNQLIPRLLEPDDYHKGVLPLLFELSNFPCKITENEFIWICLQRKYHVHLVIEEKGKIVAFGKLLLEKKIHNNKFLLGHIEDVIVSKDCRRRGFGKKIVNALIQISQVKKCYKVVLSCNDDNVTFYTACGFKRKGNEMEWRV